MMQPPQHVGSGNSSGTIPADDSSDLRFHRLLEKIPSGAYTCDAEGLITYFNERAVQIWGRRPTLNDAEDRYCGSFKLFAVDGSPIAHSECWMALALKTNQEYNGREIVIEQPGGRRLTVLAHANPIHDESGALVGAVNVLTDITEQKRMEKALRSSRERLHQLNESLEEKVKERTSALLSYQERLRLLAARLSSTEQQERRRVATDLHDNLAQLLAICKMKVAAARKDIPEISTNENIAELASALDDALRYTRSLISDLSPPFEIDGNDLFKATEWMAGKMQGHGLNVEIADDGEDKRLAMDVLTAAFASLRELLYNVIRHSGANTACVTLRRDDDGIIVTVSDEGVGFDLSAKRLEENASGGFGLFSVRERLATFGGSLEMHSAPGEGTRAVLTIPTNGYIEKRDERYLQGIEERVTSGNDAKNEPTKIRILLVDDHEMMREGLRRIINAEDDMLVVAEAADGEAAVRCAYDVQPDLIVMDVGLPNMNGAEATREILAGLPRTRVVALSLNETEEAVEEMRRAGASDYLCKSEVSESLCKAIRQYGLTGKITPIGPDPRLQYPDATRYAAADGG